jgi:hypothetical protein
MTPIRSDYGRLRSTTRTNDIEMLDHSAAMAHLTEPVNVLSARVQQHPRL